MVQQELNYILESDLFSIICALEKEKDDWCFYDCDGNKLRTPDEVSIFPSSMYGRYRKKYSDKIFFENKSSVWIMIGITEDNDVNWLQVGRNNNKSNMLSNDIKNDVCDFLYSDDSKGKYGKYRNKYIKVIFLEVNIKKYMDEDDVFKRTFGSIADDNEFAPAYNCMMAAYVEGKIACDRQVKMYKPSTLDGYFYNVLKGNLNDEK